ncbi:MAG: putative cytosolic protein [Firmicutes bacterium]|nr:putative cytosolic protein [Bacillota bacterium]
MPGKDGTGPMGSGGGGGMGRGMGRGKGRGIGPGMGNQAGSSGEGTLSSGSVGFCVCTKCGAKVPHQRAQACSSVQCPQCGSAMIRE